MTETQKAVDAIREAMTHETRVRYTLRDPKRDEPVEITVDWMDLEDGYLRPFLKRKWQVIGREVVRVTVGTTPELGETRQDYHD
jgi:hypothetical protein